MYCHKCGNKIPDNALFCMKCGAKQKYGTPSDKGTGMLDGNQDGNSRLPRVLIGIVIGAVAGLALIVGIIVAGDILRGAALRRESKQYSYGYGQDNGVSQAEVSMENDSGKTTTETAEKAYEETMSGDGTSDNNLQGITFEPSARVLNPDSEYPIVQIDDIVIPLDATYSVADLFDAMDNSVLGDDLWLRKSNGDSLNKNETIVSGDHMGWDMMYKDEFVTRIFTTSLQKDYYSCEELYIAMIYSPEIRRYYSSDYTEYFNSFATQNPAIEHVLFWRIFRSDESKTIEQLYGELDGMGIEHRFNQLDKGVFCDNCADFGKRGSDRYILFEVRGLDRQVAVSRGIVQAE